MTWIPEDKYQEIISLVPIVCVDVAIKYDNRILLIKRRDEPARGEWWLPGGRLFKGESLTNCALRKANSEIGISLPFTVGPMIHYESTNFGTVHSINFCFLLLAKSDQVILDETCLDHKWVNSPLSDLDPYINQCLLAAFAIIGSIPN